MAVSMATDAGRMENAVDVEVEDGDDDGDDDVVMSDGDDVLQVSIVMMSDSHSYHDLYMMPPETSVLHCNNKLLDSL